MVLAGAGAELEHPAEHHDEASSLLRGLLGSVPQHGGDGGGRRVVGVVVDHDVFPEPVDVAPHACSTQPREAAGRGFEVEAEGERTADGGEQWFYEVRPEDRRADLYRFATHRGDETESVFPTFDPGGDQVRIALAAEGDTSRQLPARSGRGSGGV
jgi:hypothetical protein